MPKSCHARPIYSGMLSLAACLSASGMEAETVTPMINPISRLARTFDSQLVKTEDRVSWLNDRVATFAKHREHAMKVDLGYRGFRSIPGGADPSVTLDLGKPFPLNSIYLIPTQREYLEDAGIFPKRFTIELSNHEDFSQRTVLYTSSSVYPMTGVNPVPFVARDTAQFVRLTVHEGHNKGVSDLFGLSEIVVISADQPVSFGAKVTSVGAMDAPGVWHPAALTDGRTPLGIWQSGMKSESESGDSVIVSDDHEQVSWSVDLKSAASVERVIVFPYQASRSFESGILPDKLAIHLLREDGSEIGQGYEWTDSLPGSNTMTPLVIPLGGELAKKVRVTGVLPHRTGDKKIQALSEIEVWADGKNIASGLPVSRTHGSATVNLTNLTDGFTSESRIISVALWLKQLFERSRIERELTTLTPIHRQLASESELNATWGSAVILGLTFLIPVFIVERRRLMSRDQLDQLRKRIASDLHDDIGSNLGSISLIARTARKDLVRLQGPEEVAEDLGEVESIARESSLAMRDIVWLLERRQDSIGDLVQRMRETAGRLLREINFTLECESNKTASKLSLDAKRHLFLFYKEAIHNVLKHSQANRVSVRLWDEDDKLALEILDNGVGLPMNDDEAPAAVHKLEDRARVLEGSLQIASSKGVGTQIRLLVKRSHLTAQPALS
jgi:signal transduction histidine kinase